MLPAPLARRASPLSFCPVLLCLLFCVDLGTALLRARPVTTAPCYDRVLLRPRPVYDRVLLRPRPVTTAPCDGRAVTTVRVVRKRPRDQCLFCAARGELPSTYSSVSLHDSDSKPRSES